MDEGVHGTEMELKFTLLLIPKTSRVKKINATSVKALEQYCQLGFPRTLFETGVWSTDLCFQVRAQCLSY